MRKITDIIIHCSASRPKAAQTQTAKDIDAMHRARGFRCIGYHYFIRFDGKVEKGRPDAEIGAHVEGHNSHSIGICYAGGLDLQGHSADTRSSAQRIAFVKLVKELTAKYPKAVVKGHRDYSPDLNHNGKIEKNEYMKDCPCFDAQEWWAVAKK